MNQEHHQIAIEYARKWLGEIPMNESEWDIENHIFLHRCFYIDYFVENKLISERQGKILKKRLEPQLNWLCKHLDREILGVQQIKYINTITPSNNKGKQKMIVKDMPKLQSPFVRATINNKYVVTPEIDPEMVWVFEDPNVIAVEKLDGTNVSIVVEQGTVMAIYNRDTRIPFISSSRREIIEGLLWAHEKKYIDVLGDGQHFGELIGPKVGGNPYNLKEHRWIPFALFPRLRLEYKSWKTYPKTYETISDWFKNSLMPLYALNNGQKEGGFVEGVIFYHPDGRMAKLRKDMFDWYKGKRHKEESQ